MTASVVVIADLCQPCPICGAPYGFHDEEPHAQARNRIPRELLLPTSTSVRDAVRQVKHEQYQRWLAQADATPAATTTTETAPGLMAGPLTFTGRDRQGVGRGGTTTTGNLPAWVETRYRQGWRALTVRDATLEQVGGIGPHPDAPGKRMWWASTEPVKDGAQ